MGKHPSSITRPIVSWRSNCHSGNEELTRTLIDQQLIESGWEADTQALTYKKGARPETGKNKAIAE